MIREIIVEHYRRLFGAPSREAKYVTKDKKIINILKWGEEKTKEGVTLYATIGASEYLNQTERRCEFFIGLNPEADDVAETLAELSIEGTGNNRSPKYGDTITFATPVWNNSEMYTLLITEGGEEIIPTIENDQYCVEFLQTVPLFPNELEFKKKLGEEMLWMEFEKQKIEYWNPKRLPAKV